MDNIKPYFLPSEVARLVLGYLQDIGCKLTYKCFMKECTDLVEYSTLLKQGMAYPTKIMGLSLISIINEYAVCKLQENQSCQMSTSAASLWKQFDNVTKNLKKFSQNKVRQKESQTSRTRKLNQKIDRNFGCKKSNSSDMDVNGKNTSDEEWMSDNTSVIHEVSDNNGELDHSININTTSIKSSPSKSKTTLYGMKTPISKCKYNSKRKTKNSATKVKLTNKNIELGDIEKSETAQIQSFKRTTRSSLAKKNVNVTCLQGKSPPRKNLSVNSSVLLINEDKQNLEDRSVHSTEKTLDTSQLIDDMMNATELAPVGEASFLDKTFEVVNLREKCTCDINNENDKLVNLRETVLCDTEMNGNGYLENHANNTDCQMNTVKSGVQPSQAVTHAFSTVPNCDITDGNLQSQEIDEAIKNIPVPIVTPQNTFRPINVDENSNLKTPVKSFTQLYSDQQHRSPRRKRQPPKRRQDNNITVMGGLSPDVSTCSQFLPPGPDVDENTISDYPDILERLLGDTKLHEKLAENINKKLVPIKQTKDTIENIVLEEKIQPPVDENSNGSNDNLHSISDVIKGIADMTEHDPSFESLFSLFMSAKESSVHDEVDQMICQSTSTNQLSSTSHVQTSHDQTSLFNTSSEPTDVNVGQNNSNHSNQHLQQEQQVYSTQQSVILASSMNQNNNSNIADTTLQTHIQDNLSVTSPSSCDALVQHNNYFQTSVGIAGRSVVQSVNRPDCLPFSSNQIRQPVTALSQLDNKINPIPYVVSVADAPHVYNIINLNSPAIASPDPYIVPTPERIPNSQGKLRKPKRITPTPLCGNEVLPDIGKIASPHKPLNLIPEISGDKDYSASGCSPQVPSFLIQERHSTNSNSQPCDVVNTQTSVDTDTSLSNSLQYIGTEYPQLSQTEQENASVCDISTSPGGQNILFLNKRPFSTAKEENSSCVLSPITPVNEKSQSVSSTPHSMVPMSKNALSKPTTNLSPIQEFKKPNMLTRSSKKSTPQIQRLPKTENIVLTSYSLSPLKTDASVIHGSINQTAFTAVPLGKLSRRFCHVRNLDFGSNSEIIHSTDVVEMQPKKKNTNE